MFHKSGEKLALAHLLEVNYTHGIIYTAFIFAQCEWLHEALFLIVPPDNSTGTVRQQSNHTQPVWEETGQEGEIADSTLSV